jgi:hypothetical protein
MVGSWLVNVIVGFLGFILVFFSAFTNNDFMTSLIRGCIAYVSFFVMAYLFRWMIYFIISDRKGNTTSSEQAVTEVEHNSRNEELTRSIDDLSTTDAELVSKYIKDLLNQKE